jgi:hypothetical protein
MASVRVDDKARTDWRFAALGRLLGKDRRWALGAMIDVWSHCTQEQTYSVQAVALDFMADVDGFAEAMVKAELGEVQDDGAVRVRGTAGRIEWLGDRREAARRGGQANGKQTRSKREANASPLVLAPVTAPVVSEEATDSVVLAHDGEQQLGLKTADGSTIAPAPTAAPRRTPPVPAILIKARAEAALFLEWFNRQFGRQFQVRGENVSQVKNLLIDRHTQGAMRLVSMYLRKQWQGDPKHERWLVPLTLLLRVRLGEYGDAARAADPSVAETCDKLDARPIVERLERALEHTGTGPIAESLAAALVEHGAPVLRTFAGGKT